MNGLGHGRLYADMRVGAVCVCDLRLVGGGQEINTGEAGIGEWLQSLQRSFQHWQIYTSPQLSDSEYQVENILNELQETMQINRRKELHLAVSLRSFRAENVSLLVK